MIGFLIAAAIFNSIGFYFAMLVIKGPYTVGLPIAAACVVSGTCFSIGITLCVYIAIKEARR